MDNNIKSTPASSEVYEDFTTIACQRCRRRKIRCDRKNPCSRCRLAGSDCIRGSGEKLRPVPKSYVQALESQVASLEILIQKLSDADNEQRDAILEGYRSKISGSTAPPEKLSESSLTNVSGENEEEIAQARARTGQLRKTANGGAAQYYGGTSLFQVSLSGEFTTLLRSGCGASDKEIEASDSVSQAGFSTEGGFSPQPAIGYFQYGPLDAISQKLLVIFFKEQYMYNMCVHREYFMRDYHNGGGRHYSDMLIYAICAMGAVAADDAVLRPLSEVYSQQAQHLLFCSLDSPNVPMLQALLVLGQCEIGQGRTSKGWLFCGIAFRLAHEMGLHLDPANWNDANGPLDQDIDREIVRRVYWAAFVVDKQLSLYFGRPPALYTHESDVRNPVRLPYPPNWETLLDGYGIKDNSVADGITLVDAFIQQAELSKILHRMITDLFENRRSKADNAVVTATKLQVHVALTKWHMTLPSKLHWNQWTVGKIPACVIHLHLLFHTAMIIMHRPPHHLYSKAGTAASEDVEMCYESVGAILRLIRIYGRYYNFRFMPLDFTYTLSTAAGAILMRRFLEDLPWDDAEIARQLGQILQAMDAVKQVWPCIAEIRDGILHARDLQSTAIPQTDMGYDVHLMSGLLNLEPSMIASDAMFHEANWPLM